MLSVRPGEGLRVANRKDDRNKKTSHLILKISMNEAFIWFSGLRFFDKKIING